MRYVVISPLTLPAGLVIGLDPKQAERRAHALEEAGKGLFRTTVPIDLKTGEVIHADALPKALWPKLKEARAARLERNE